MKIITITVDGTEYVVSRAIAERAGLCRPETGDSTDTTSALAVVVWIVTFALSVIFGLIWGCL